MISVAEADRRLAGLIPSRSAETVALERAVGRILAEELVADRDGPPYDRVAMDGYAVDASEEVRTWTITGLQLAGRPPLDRTGRATAIEVATGAVLPRGCDAVIPYETTQRTNDTVGLKDGEAFPVSGRHVHRKGTDFHQGDVLLQAGTRLLSPHLHSLASAGIDPVAVVRRPVWALAATGDELVDIREQPEAWQIRRSNAAAIAGEAAAWGLAPRDQVVLPDDQDKLVRGIEQLLPDLDVLVLTGGASAGVLDLVPAALKALGVETIFHKINQRPGKPLWCGRLPSSQQGSATLVFGLPGNPVSSLFAFRRYVLPWLLACEGRPPAERRVKAPMAERIPPGQTIFVPWSDTLGRQDTHGSGDFLALAGSTGFLEIDNDPRSLKEPRYFPWGGVL